MSTIEADRELLIEARAAGGHQHVVDTFLRILQEQRNWPDERIDAAVRLILDMREEALAAAPL